MSRLSFTRTMGVFLLTIFTTLAIAPTAVVAGTQGRRNTAIGLSAGAVYSAIRGKGGAALALGAGAAYAWKREHDSKTHHKHYARSRGHTHHQQYTR